MPEEYGRRGQFSGWTFAIVRGRDISAAREGIFKAKLRDAGATVLEVGLALGTT